jgi:cephalosporin-C deacetylase-like acetyl esterase
MRIQHFFILIFLSFLTTATQFLPAPITDVLKIEVDLGIGNFQVGTPITVKFTIKNPQYYAIEGDIMATLATLDRKIVAGYDKKVNLASQQIQQATLSGSASETGVYLLYVRFTQKTTQTRLISKTYIVGYGLHTIDSKTTRATDFKTFWNSAKAELAKVAPEYKLTKQPTPAHGLYQAYNLEMKSANDYTIKGVYRVPTKGSKFPVMLQLPSLGGLFVDAPSLGENAYRGTPTDFAVLSLNIRAHGKSDSPFIVKDYHQLITYGLADKNTYFYKGALLDCMRAIDFLASRPEINQEKIGVEGMSQGGGLSLLLAGLDSRISMCAPDVPFLCDVETLVTDATWASDQLKRYQKTVPTISIWTLQQNFRYFDTKNVADWISCPVVMSVGLQDWTCPPHTCYATYNKIKSAKDIYLYTYGAHEGGGKAHRKLKFEWIREKWGMK